MFDKVSPLRWRLKLYCKLSAWDKIVQQAFLYKYLSKRSILNIFFGDMTSRTQSCPSNSFLAFSSTLSTSTSTALSLVSEECCSATLSSSPPTPAPRWEGRTNRLATTAGKQRSNETFWKGHGLSIDIPTLSGGSRWSGSFFNFVITVPTTNMLKGWVETHQSFLTNCSFLCPLLVSRRMCSMISKNERLRDSFSLCQRQPDPCLLRIFHHFSFLYWLRFVGIIAWNVLMIDKF